MSGDTTTVSPGSISAGTWKHSDLPPPVGQDDERVAAGEHGAHGALLSRAESSIAEARAEDRAGVVERRRRHLLLHAFTLAAERARRESRARAIGACHRGAQTARAKCPRVNAGPTAARTAATSGRRPPASASSNAR